MSCGGGRKSTGWPRRALAGDRGLLWWWRAFSRTCFRNGFRYGTASSVPFRPATMRALAPEELSFASKPHARAMATMTTAAIKNGDRGGREFQKKHEQVLNADLPSPVFDNWFTPYALPFARRYVD